MSERLHEQIEKNRRAASLAQAETDRIIREDYPVGGAIKWTIQRGSVHSGTVTYNDASGRLKVCNSRTGKEYWIHDYDIHTGHEL